MKNISIVLFAFIAEFIFSKIGLMFAIPFGFASSIWPAAGISLGIYLLFGRPALVGVFFGYLLAVYHSGMAFDLETWALPVTLCVCSLLQLIITKRIIFKYIKLPVETSKLSKLVKFLLIIGPLSCLVASALGASILYVVNDLNYQEAIFTWAIWWVGDFTGVLFFAPLVLFIKPNAIVETPAQPLKIVFSNVIVFCFISLLFAFSSDKYQAQNQLTFEQKTTAFIKQFENAQESIKHQLLALSGLFQSSDFVSRNDFENFSQKIADKNINLRAVAWIPKVTRGNRAAFEQKAKSEGFDDFEIKYLAAKGFKTSPQAAVYFPILYSEPLKSNRAALGLDLNSHPSVKNELREAMENDKFTVTATLPLVQQQDKFTGVIVYYPVYKSGALDPTRPHLEQLLGSVEAVFELDVLLQNLPAADQDEFAFEFTYGAGNTFQSKGFNSNGLFSHQVLVDVFDKQGTLRFTSLKEFESHLVDWASWLVVVGGTLFGVVSIIFLYSITSFSANLEMQVLKKTQDLTESNKKLELANRAKTMFLANMSHEYRTPLNAIIGFTEIAKRQTKDVEASKYLGKIEASSQTMLNIVNDVLDISKIQTNEFELENSSFQPTESLNHVADMLREIALGKGLDFIVDIDDLGDIWVKGDNYRFKQIAINLLSNAIKFTDNGFVKLSATVFSKTVDSYQLQVVVSDSGLGIEEDKQKIIFKPFQQAESTTTRRFGGTGLGLSIVNELTHLMYGDIQVSSKVGAGSEFRAMLMFSKSEPQILKATLDDKEEVNEESFVGLNVLIVEDNLVNQEVVKKQLESLGAVPSVSNNGQECLDYLQSNTPDIILMDLQMPVLDGFMTSKAIRNNPNWDGISIIILSASVTQEDRLIARELGIKSYLAKPFFLEQLKAVLRVNLPS
ncbi:CHASE domain-containing protein [Psychrosphaera sp. B3R10]|uniref:CHASE domain-containing protein n=1 Tax=unclassified Psychrosphaera TaxID=2641570 RepID=UPI001C09AB2E|nr:MULTISPECIES: CHASE domain-containing protein [unclassified Psychrosphaera]MBU2880441.1 CHASE domain-containing protein [Psychrosphaera sp. I2R16]MBU2991458.1 CHASE domain-containing protein [Psychrosphaera sp. B3R10]MDO6719350.1 CHASE domain-containing protein [Psychrosphaera sp. 1_MG-2023]